MMRRFTSAPNPASRVRVVHLAERSPRVRRRAQAVAHAVVAREVRARFGRGDQVVDGDRAAGCAAARRRRTVAPSRSSDAQRSRRTPRARPDRRRSSSRRARHADPQALARRRSSAADERRARRARPRVASRGSAPLIDLETERGIRDRSRERADLIERRRERDEAVARDAAVRRLHARRCRRARPAGESIRRCPIRARAASCPPPRRPPIRRSIRPASGRAPTDCATARTRSSRSTIPSRTRRRSVLPTMTAPACFEPLDDRRVERRDVVLEDPRSGGRRHARAPRCCP